MYYFAYGSNMLAERLRRRVPSAEPWTTARLPGHDLRFHKRGADGSGKCDAYATGRPGDEVMGVVYRIAPAELAALDRVEGGYRRLRLAVAAGRGVSRAFLYVARPVFVDAALSPFVWYQELVVAGARQHALPRPYVRRLAATVAEPDPDPERSRHHRRILRGWRARRRR